MTLVLHTVRLNIARREATFFLRPRYFSPATSPPTFTPPTPTAAMYLEDERFIHEDLERLEQA
ncbi:hypothetical protein IMZ48_04205, partial [Candidatus Bathyarchaeota archaeon]|nr:hypothetical protein [Candidatus Bathyarchaeota archaeon]